MAIKADATKGADPEPRAKGGAPAANTDKRVPEEVGGPKGPEPTRYGDWQHKGRVSDF